PRSGLRPYRGGQRPAPLVARPQEQPLLPGPGKNENKMLGRVQKTSRWSAERRGVGSLRRRALASKVRARVRSCTHPDADAASGRLPALRPPLVGAGKQQRRRKRTENRGSKNEGLVGWHASTHRRLHMLGRVRRAHHRCGVVRTARKRAPLRTLRDNSRAV